MFFRVYNGNWQRWVQIGGSGLVTSGFNPNKEGHRLSGSINLITSSAYARLMDNGDIGKTYKFWGLLSLTVVYLPFSGEYKQVSVTANQILFLTCMNVENGLGRFSAELKVR